VTNMPGFTRRYLIDTKLCSAPIRHSNDGLLKRFETLQRAHIALFARVLTRTGSSN